MFIVIVFFYLLYLYCGVLLGDFDIDYSGYFSQKENMLSHKQMTSVDYKDLDGNIHKK